MLYLRYEAGAGVHLFNFGIDPFFPGDYEPQFTIYKGLKKVYTSFWGLGPGVQNIRGTFAEIPVAVDALNFGQPGVIPRQVVLTINYYQIDQYTKRMVTAGISYPLQSQCVALTSGGLVQQSLLAAGIPQCIQDINGATASQDYLVEVYYIPMNWHQLLNHFQFTEEIYLIFFIVTGIVANLLGAFVWGVNRLLTKLRHPPPFHGWSLFYELAQPCIIGISLGTAPLMFAVLVIWKWFMSFDNGGPFCMSDAQISALTSLTVVPTNGLMCLQDLTDWQASADPDQVLRPGRQQLAILFVGVFATFVFARLILPKYSDQDRLTDVEREALKNKKDDKKAAAIAQAAAPGTIELATNFL